MRPTAPILMALLAAPAAAAPSVREFELPPGPTATPTASAPQVQGPVDPEAPAATRPRPVEARPSTPAATPSPTATETADPVARTVPPPTAARPARTGATPRSEPVEVAPTEAPPADQTTAPPATFEPTEAPPESPAQGDTTGSWSWLAGVAAGFLILLGALAAGLLWWRRRTPLASKAPQIELLLVTPEDGAAAPIIPAPPPPLATVEPLQPAPSLRIDATPSHLTRSMMAATFTCRVTLENRGETALEDITLGLDLTTAHGSVPTSEQLADPARPLPETGRIARIAPGERVELAQDVRLPTAEIRTLRQGEAHLYVPLLRVRAQAGTLPPIARTFIVGTLPDTEARKLQPFRLDEMPQTYRLIGVAALD